MLAYNLILYGTLFLIAYAYRTVHLVTKSLDIKPKWIWRLLFLILSLFMYEANEDAATVFVPFSTFQRVFNYGDIVSYYGFAPKSGVPTSVIETKIIDLLKERHSILSNQ